MMNVRVRVRYLKQIGPNLEEVDDDRVWFSRVPCKDEIISLEDGDYVVQLVKHYNWEDFPTSPQALLKVYKVTI